MARHQRPGQAAREAGEVGQSVGDERDEAGRAPRVEPLEDVQHAIHLRLIGLDRSAVEGRGQEDGVYRRHLKLHIAAVILRWNREVRGDIKLDIGRDDGRADPPRSEGEEADRLERTERYG